MLKVASLCVWEAVDCVTYTSWTECLSSLPLGVTYEFWIECRFRLSALYYIYVSWTECISSLPLGVKYECWIECLTALYYICILNIMSFLSAIGCYIWILKRMSLIFVNTATSVFWIEYLSCITYVSWREYLLLCQHHFMLYISRICEHYVTYVS